jgi:hypothetical protein
MSEENTADFTVESAGLDDLLDGLDPIVSDETNTLTDLSGSVESNPQESPAEPLFEIDGKPITLEEARNGYLRQSDYTKKTQELSEMRSRLADAEAIAEALRTDPTGTLKALSDAFGVDVTLAKPARSNDEFSLFDDLEDGDPTAERLAMLERKIAEQEQAATQAAIQQELLGLKEQYGDFDESELFAHAIKGGFPTLSAAYADLNFGSLRSEYERLLERQREIERRVNAKREASKTVHTGASRSGVADTAKPSGYGSLREAYLAAKKSLGA